MIFKFFHVFWLSKIYQIFPDLKPISLNLTDFQDLWELCVINLRNHNTLSLMTVIITMDHIATKLSLPQVYQHYATILTILIVDLGDKTVQDGREFRWRHHRQFYTVDQRQCSQVTVQLVRSCCQGRNRRHCCSQRVHQGLHQLARMI